MTTRIGMDPHVIGELASQIDSVSHEIGSLIGSVDATVGQVGQEWYGADASQFHSDWLSAHRPAMAALAQAIEQLAARARSNIAEQQSASAAGAAPSGTGLGVGAVIGAVGALDILDAFDRRLSDLSDVVGIPGRVRQWDGILHELPSPPKALRAVEHGIGEAARAARSLGSRVLDTRLGRDVVGAEGRLMDTRAVGVVGDILHGVVRKLGPIGAAVSVATASADAGSAFGAGQYAQGVNDVVVGAADALKSNPVTYLGGVVVSGWDSVVNQATKIDWSQPIPLPTPSNLIHDYLPAVGEAAKEAVGDIVGWLL